ncbi:MAG: zinc-dependent alcohol dehydrogenase [Ktedonobacterales bacterium]
MWSVYLDTNPMRTLSSRGLGLFSRRAYYGPLAPLRSRRIAHATLPGRHWVRVRNIISGVSGTDIALTHLQLDPRVSLAALPRQSKLYLGHEVVGEVSETGPDVEFLRIGDRVAYQFDQCCATRDVKPPCRHCTMGNYALCENRYLPGPAAIGGGWSDEMIVHERQLFLVPDSLTDEQAALLEPCAVALHTALRHLPQPGDNVLVIGGGTIGLLTTQAVRILAPEVTIASIARYPVQIEMATRMGANRILYQADGTSAIARHTGGHHFKRHFGPDLLIGGFDVVYDTIGSTETLQNAIRWTRGGGAVVQAGRQLAPSALDLTPLWHQEISLLGASGHGTEDWPANAGIASWTRGNSGRVFTYALTAALIREHRLTPERLITHRFPLREVRHAVEVARDKSTHHSIKVILDIGDSPASRLTAESLTATRLTSSPS